MKHGFVTASGIDGNGKKVVVSSQSRPLVESATYDPNLVTEISAFQRAVSNLQDRVKQLFIGKSQQAVKE